MPTTDPSGQSAIPPVAAELSLLDPTGAIAETAERARSVTRRTLIAGGVALGATLLAAPGGLAKNGDTAVLNFALTLEYFQAAFYSEAERRGALSGQNAQAAKLIGSVERAHVKALKGLLGRDAVARPFFDFQGTTEDDAAFVKTAVGFEDFSAAAYQGALGLLNQPQVISGAASIHTVEARHAAWLRFLQGASPAARGLDDPIDHGEAMRLVASTGFVKARPRMESHSAPAFAG